MASAPGPVDIYVLCGLATRDISADGWTLRSLAAQLGLPLTAVHRALKRAETAQLYNARHRRVQLAALEQLLVHAAPFVLPPKRLGLTVGMPTADSAPVLARRIRAADDALPLVWPQAEGIRGEGLEPLHPAAPAASVREPALYDLLALIDALRTGNARVRGVARELLTERLRSGVTAA